MEPVDSLGAERLITHYKNISYFLFCLAGEIFNTLKLNMTCAIIVKNV